ncbi:MAG: glycosyltransferase family 2 protein, partial [Candidatus Thermoplasmatota archaeon]|nr:glycosyltransferase family 2 protein [Candidatus Thermoplasmatota archaeon]
MDADMMGGQTIGVVIPAQNEEAHIATVLETLPEFVDYAVVIDDGSNDATYKMASKASSLAEVTILQTEGMGVGAAIDLGHQHLLKTIERPFVSVIMAGDGQMDPNDLAAVVQPILDDEADHVKGNRMSTPADIEQMPKQRRRASRILGWLTTLASGRVTSDPQCGYTATSSNLLQQWDWERSWQGYGYPNYWLIHLSSHGWRIQDVRVKAVYGYEQSGIKPVRFFASVGRMMTVEHHRRAFKHLFGSVWMMLSFLFYMTGYVFGIY